MKTSLPGAFGAFCFLAINLAISSSFLHAQPPEGDKGKKDLSRELLGAWVLVGEPGNVEDPQPGAQMKFWGERHWVISEADPKTGATVYHHGGTYTLDGDKYIETITFANENTAYLIGKEFRFTIKVEGDTYTQVGNGNPYTQVWKRLRK